MSAISSTASSAVNYATQLAQSSSLKRSLNNIGNAVQDGDLTSANTLLTAFLQNNPQYAPGTSGTSQDPISQDFQTLVNAVSGNQVAAAQSAWTQVKTDLAKDGVQLSNQTDAVSQLVAQSNNSTDQAILGDLFGTSASGGSSLASLLGTSSSAGNFGVDSSLLNDWATFESGGSTTPSTATGTVGSILNTAG